MKKLSKTNELLWVFGIVFVALGVCICSKANLGVSMIAAPAFIISEALSKVFSGVTVGVTEYVFQGVLLIILCIAIKRFTWRYLLAFASAVIYGYTLNFFLYLLNNVSFDTIIIRWIMLIIGDCSTAFGVACFFKTYLPLQVYELFVAELSKHFKLNINKVKWSFDISLLVLSIILAVILFRDVNTFDWSSIVYTNYHSIGLGTLVTTVINSPIIMFWGKLVNIIFEPTARFTKLEKALKKGGC